MTTYLQGQFVIQRLGLAMTVHTKFEVSMFSCSPTMKI